MQEYIRNFITEFCDKGTHTEEDIKQLEDNIIKFGCEIFNIEPSVYDNIDSDYGQIAIKYKDKCDDTTKVANYLAMCNLRFVYTNKK